MKIYLFLLLFLGLSFTNLENQKITIIGKASNAKAGAVVVTDDNDIYYIDGLAVWPKEFYEKKVKVVGKLVIEKREKRKEGEPAVAEIVGAKNTIKKPKWSLAE